MRVEALVADEGQLARISGSRFGRVSQSREVTSTNAVLLEQARSGAAEGLVVLADHQSAGRGRFDRRWESPPGTSLLFSVLLRPSSSELPERRWHLAMAAVSLAVVDAARQVAEAELALKWPNDLVAAGGPLADRKVGGVLAELCPSSAAEASAIVVGTGLNVHWAPGSASATCLDALARRPADRGELLVESLLALDGLYGRWDEVAELYRERCATIGRDVTVSFAGPGGGPDLEGKAVGLDEDGCLLVEPAGLPTGGARVVKVAAGDVTHASMAAPRVVKQ